MFRRDLDRVMRSCLRTFGEKFEYSSAGSEKRIVKGIFDHNHQMIEIRDGAQVSSFGPVLGVHAKDFPVPIEPGDKFTHSETGKVYTVEDIQPDSGYRLNVIMHLEE